MNQENNNLNGINPIPQQPVPETPVQPVVTEQPVASVTPVVPEMPVPAVPVVETPVAQVSEEPVQPVQPIVTEQPVAPEMPAPTAPIVETPVAQVSEEPVQPVQPIVTEQPVAPEMPAPTASIVETPVPEVPVQPVQSVGVEPSVAPAVSPVTPAVQPSQPVMYQNNGTTVNTFTQVNPNGVSVGVNTFSGTTVGASKSFNLKDLKGNKIIYGIIAFFVILLLILLLSNKTLTCTDSTYESGLDFEKTIITKYKFGKFSKMSVKYVITIEDEDETDYTVDDIAEEFEDLEDDSMFDNFKIDTSKNKVTITADYSDDYIEDNLDDDEEVKGYSDLKEEFEDEDMTCK